LTSTSARIGWVRAFRCSARPDWALVYVWSVSFTHAQQTPPMTAKKARAKKPSGSIDSMVIQKARSVPLPP